MSHATILPQRLEGIVNSDDIRKMFEVWFCAQFNFEKTSPLLLFSEDVYVSEDVNLLWIGFIAGFLNNKTIVAPEKSTDQKIKDNKTNGTEKIWECKIGGIADALPDGADYPMRLIVAAAFRTVTGSHPKFFFSGWGAELTEVERAVVNNEV